jgi:hypothetical protein
VKSLSARNLGYWVDLGPSPSDSLCWLQVMSLGMANTFNGRCDNNGRLLLHDPTRQQAWAWLTERAAVNLVRFHRPELEPLRRNVLYATLGHSCVLHCNLESATERFEACRRALGKCPTIVATVDEMQIQTSGAVNAGRNSTCPPLAAMRTRLGTSDQAALHTAALEELLQATRGFAALIAADRALELRDAQCAAEKCRMEASRAAADKEAILAVYNRERFARGRQGQESLSRSGAVAAEGEPPALEPAGLQPGRRGQVVCPAAGADGVFVMPELRLMEGVGTREGIYVVRFSVHAAGPAAPAHRPGR